MRNLHNALLKANWQPLKSSLRSILLIFNNDLNNGTEFVDGMKLERRVVTAGVETPRSLSELAKPYEML